MDYDDDRVVRTSVSILKEDSKYLKDNDLSPTDLLRKAICNNKNNTKKNTREERFKYFKERVIIIFIGLICLFISQLRTIPDLLNILFALIGAFFIFVGIFDLLMKIIPLIRRGGK